MQQYRKKEYLIQKYNKERKSIPEIAKINEVHKKTIAKWMERNNIPRRSASEARRRYALDQNVFSDINEKSAYWIGFIMADGSIHSNRIRIAIHPRDRKHLKKLRTFLSSSHPIKTRNIQNPLVELCFTSKKIVKDLNQYGITPNKSKSANIAELQSNRHFWRGMVDGDGWINYHHGTQIGLTGSKNNIKKFKTFCLEIINSKAQIREINGSYSYQLGSNKAKPIIKRLYNYQIITLDRKYKSAKQYGLGIPEVNIGKETINKDMANYKFYPQP